jgi:tyrosinase
MVDIDRRALLSGAVGLTTLVALGGCESILRKIRDRPVRRDVSTMGSSDPMLQAYRDGIARMRALPSSDPRNYTRIAQIHESFCPHGNWFFLPWHRAYLLSIERIIRQLTGVDNFALPYWNWSCQRAIPAPFWEAGSPLLHADRWIGPTDQADASVVGQSRINILLAETDFELFASGYATALRPSTVKGPLESGPHDYIHASFIGGTMRSFMSPLDPIFWLHHGILDYLWFDWNSRGNPNSNDPAYTNLMISGQMVDGAGSPVDYQVGALILAPLLSYRYEPPARCFRISPFLTDEAVLRRFLEKGAEVRLRTVREFPPIARGLTLDPRQQAFVRVALPPDAVRAALAPDAQQRLLLRVDDIQPPSDGTFVRVFVGLPEGESPTPESPHYAGAFAFFVDPDHPGHHGGALNYHVDLTPAIEQLRADGRLSDVENVAVTFHAVPADFTRAPAMAARPISFGRIQPVLIQRKPEPQRPR